MGIIKKNIDLRCFLSETSKLVYEPFRDFKYNRKINGIKTHPIINAELKEAVLTSSKVNNTNAAYNGIVNKGCPATDTS